MIDNGVNTDIHMSRVATWVVNTLGKAIAISVAVAFVFGVAGAVMQQALVAAAGGLFAPIAFAAVLYNASAPLPDER